MTKKAAKKANGQSDKGDAEKDDTALQDSRNVHTDSDSSDEHDNESSSSDSASSSSEDEDDEDEDEVEPQLKYQRITSLPKPVFNQDPVSACLVADDFFAFATHSGFVHLTNPDFSLIRSYRAHTASILDLATDGTYLASASIDGRVVIGSINDPKDITASDFKRPVHAVALDPNYKSTKRFISGGMAGDVILSERGWLGQRSDFTLNSSEDPVIAVYWIESIFIWMNESGISIFSQYTKKLLLDIPRPEGSPRGDMYKPRLTTPESNRIYIAWADRVWILKTEFPRGREGKNLLSSTASIINPSGASTRSVAAEPTIEIESAFHVDCLVAGVAPFTEDTLMMLAYLPPPPATEEVRRPLAPNPEIRLIEMETGNEVYGDELALKGYERLGMNDYYLCQHSSALATRYLIISAKDGIVAQQRDLSDKIAWLLEHENFKEAWEMSLNVKDPADRYRIGLDWIESLVEKEDWSQAAQALETVQEAYLKSDVKAESVEPTKEEGLSAVQLIVRDNWNQWGWIFSEAGHIGEIAPRLPLDHSLAIESKLYEAVLTTLIDESKFDSLLSYLKKWPIELYDFSTVKRYLEDLLHDHPPQESELRKTLSNLYISAGDPLSAVQHLLILHDSEVLTLVSKCHLLPSLPNEIPDLLTVNLKSKKDIELAPLPIIREEMSSAIAMIVSARHEVTPDFVVQQVLKRKMEVVAFLYLEQLNAIDSFASQKFGDLQARLYAEFDRPKLMGFLKKSNNYNLEGAAEVCESRGYIPELVYILGKIGQNKRALKLVLEELNDPDQAIEFAKQQNDKELWDEVLKYSVTRPSFMKSLLDRASGIISPASILRRMPDGMEIPGLKEVIGRIFAEHELTLSLNLGILDIVNIEAQRYAAELRAARTEGTMLDFSSIWDEKKTKKDSNNQQPDYSSLDFTQSIVVLPNGELANEGTLIGEANLWSQKATGVSTFANRSVGQKMKHLAYIRRKLELAV